MSVATEISRIQTNRNTIRTKLVELGMASNTANLDALADAIEGIVNRGAVSVEILEGTTYTIPAGYHNGSGTVKAMTDITGEAETYKTQTKTVTPTKSKQNVSPDTGYYALESVTVNAIPDNYQDVSSVTAAAGDVLTGKVYVTASGAVVTGNMVNNGTVSKTLDVTTISYTIPKGYHSGSGTVKITLETKTVTPTKSTQSITPTSGKVLSKVTVNPIPSEYADVSDATAAAGHVLAGETAYTWGGIGSGVDGVAYTAQSGAIALVEDCDPCTLAYADTVSVSGTTVSLVSPVSSSAAYYDPQKANADAVIQVTADLLRGKYITSNYGTNQDSTGMDDPSLEARNYGLVYISTDAVFEEMSTEGGDIALVCTSGWYTVSAGSGGSTVEGATKIVGTMPNRGAVTASLNTSTTSYTIPAGYHNGSGNVSLTTETKTATPTKSSQSITPSSGKVLSKVTVNAIPAAYQDVTGVTATAANVLDDKYFVTADGTRTEGTMPNKGAVTASLNTTTTSYTIPAGYHNGSGKVSITTETKSATPTKSAQTITPTSGKVLSSVSVAAIPAAYQDVTSVTAVAADVLTGKVIVNSSGTKVTGSMANNGSVSTTIDGLTTTSVSIPAGYTSGGTVSLTSDIEEALAAI